MSDGILKEVLQLEQQIETTLSREQKRAEVWLAETCRAVDKDLSYEQEGDAHAYEQQSAEAIRMARHAAAQKLRAERRRARTLVGLSNDTLLPLLDSRLKAVFIGSADDCPDDQS